MSFNYDKAFRANNNPNERIELNSSCGEALKKYNSNGGWPEYSAIQQPGQSHLGDSGKTPYGFTHSRADLNAYGSGMNKIFK